jgi:hypothetical protein
MCIPAALLMILLPPSREWTKTRAQTKFSPGAYGSSRKLHAPRRRVDRPVRPRVFASSRYFRPVRAPMPVPREKSPSAADVVLSGSLERLLGQSIFVRLADDRLVDARLPHTADLSAEAIAAHYSLADQVRIACRPIRTVYDEELALHQHLELKKLQRLGPASPEELARVAARLSRQAGANLLHSPAPAPPADAPAAAEALLEHVRQVNLDFAARLPNFVADEIGKRYTTSLASMDWRYVDTIESEIAFRGGRASREHIRLNGKPWNRPFLDLPGAAGLWGVFFGTQLRPLFSPDCPTRIEFEGRREADGRSLLAFRFSSPPAACFRAFFHGDGPRYRPARTGRFLVDDPGGHMIRYEEEAIGFPEDFGLDRHTVVESWDYVKIGDAAHLLPVRVEIVSRTADGSWARDTVEYRNHRRFEASSDVVFPSD